MRSASAGMSENFYETTKVGLSYSKYLTSLSDKELKSLDYIEVPFELLRFDSTVFQKMPQKPMILHCASLSLGGYTPPDDATREKLLHYVAQTKTPWIGEHLSYILAEKVDDNYYEAYSEEPYNIGYTVNPVMNLESVENVVSNISLHEAYFNTPIIVENSPLYFKLPASNMTQTAFINSICEHSETKLLLDLAHFYISSQNFSFDPRKEITKLPLHRVVEVHMSGVTASDGSHWDDHAAHAPEILFDLLEIVLKNVKPKAVTFEYNWTPKISWDRLEQDLSRVREMINSS